MFVTTIKISEGIGSSMMKFIVCIQMRIAEAFVLFYGENKGAKPFESFNSLFSGSSRRRTEKGMMFTRHHSVEK